MESEDLRNAVNKQIVRIFILSIFSAEIFDGMSVHILFRQPTAI